MYNQKEDRYQLLTLPSSEENHIATRVNNSGHQKAMNQKRMQSFLAFLEEQLRLQSELHKPQIFLLVLARMNKGFLCLQVCNNLRNQVLYRKKGSGANNSRGQDRLLAKLHRTKFCALG